MSETVVQGLSELLGESESLLRVKERLSQAAKVDRPVLILGARGTGKELAAARLHFLSPRWHGPYITLNCAALAPSLLDSELFGFEAGSFTGAVKRRPGRFEAANGGTLFLDEISHLTLEAQARILRVVEYGSFQSIGSTTERRVDVRVTAATNADLRRMCREGTFLPDLWDRLSFEVITLPPLSKRPGDISLLANYFAARMARELGFEAPPIFSEPALAALEAYSWPGNVRELKNVIERAVYRRGVDGGQARLEPWDLQLDTGIYPRESDNNPEDRSGDCLNNNAKIEPKGLTSSLPSPLTNSLPNSLTTSLPTLPLAQGGFDQYLRLEGQKLIEAALQQAKHNQKQAAELLGMSYHRFRSLKKKLDG